MIELNGVLGVNFGRLRRAVLCELNEMKAVSDEQRRPSQDDSASVCQPIESLWIRKGSGSRGSENREGHRPWAPICLTVIS